MTTLCLAISLCEIPKYLVNLKKSQKQIVETYQYGHSDYPRMPKGLKSHCSNAESISQQEKKGKVPFFISSINWLSERREKV